MENPQEKNKRSSVTNKTKEEEKNERLPHFFRFLSYVVRSFSLSRPNVCCVSFFFFLFLLDRDEASRGRANTRAAVEDGLVGQGELGEVAADHLTLDFHRLEALAGVDGDDGANHLRDDDHVAQVGAHRRRLLANLGRLLRLAELLHQRHGLSLHAALEASARARGEDLGEFVVLQRNELFQLKPTVGELVEGTLLLELLVALTVDVAGHFRF